MLEYLHLLNNPNADTYRCLASLQTIPARTLVAGPEEENAKVIFLVSGLLRGFLVDESGADFSDCFVFQYGDFRLTSLRGERRVVKYYVETLEETAAISFDAADLMPYMVKDPEFVRTAMKSASEVYAEHIHHKHILCHTSASERYRWFLSNYPGLIDRVPHRHIASFLNMTPVTLSRLRRAEREK